MNLKEKQAVNTIPQWAVNDRLGNELRVGSFEDAKAYYDANKHKVIEDAYLVDGSVVNSKHENTGQVKNILGWKDLIAPFASSKTRETTEPSWEDIGNGIFLYRFTDGEEVFAQFHIGHDYKQETLAFPHIHFLPKEEMAVGETVEWQFIFTIAKGHQQGDSLTVAPTVIDLVYTATGNEVAGEHIVLECSELQAIDLIEADAVIVARIVKTSGTYAGKVFGIMADVHYQSETETTINKSPNFYE